MKRILICLLSAAFAFLVCGCDGYKYPSETDMEYMVSSLGFDKKGNSVFVCAEIIVVNSSDSEKPPESKLFEGYGENVESAIYNLHKGIAKPLMLKHCGLLAIGEGIEGDTLKNVFSVLSKNEDITQAIEVVWAKSAQKLLALKADSNIALGYELTTALKQNSSHTGIVYKNRLYEIAARREKKAPYYTLPVFNVLDQKYAIDGVKIFFDDTAVLSADEKDATLHAMMSDNFESGQINLDGDCFKVESSKIKYDFRYIKNRLQINAEITVNTKKDKIKILEDAISAEKISNIDIYGFLDRIYAEKPKLFEEIKDNYAELFSKATINFTVRGKGDE